MKKLVFAFFLYVFSAGFVFAQEGVYEGELNGFNQPHGRGTYSWPDGTKYTGRWRNGLMSGEGKINYADGSKYEGSWLDGVMDGFGTYTWANGDVYEGWFDEGKKSGMGRLKLSNGAAYDGQWEKDVFSGQGKMKWSDGSEYIGEWRSGKRNGNGIMIYPDGRIEQGAWKDDEYVNCKCKQETLSVEQAYAQSAAVFVGRVISINSVGGEMGATPGLGFDLVELEVLHLWKGKVFPKRRIYLRANYTSCDIVFFENETYLVYASNAGDGVYTTDKCTRTINIRNVRFDLALLEKEIPCRGPSRNEQAFSRENEPVCGCDGKTYINPFEAERAGVLSWKAGKCD